MASRHSIVYAANVDDSLATIADRFGLSSGVIISASPKNQLLKDVHLQEKLEEGRVVHVPPNPEVLLQERFGLLNVINALLREQSHVHGEYLRTVLPSLVRRPAMTGEEAVRIFGELDQLVCGQVVAVDAHSRALKELNLGLLESGFLGGLGSSAHDPRADSSELNWLLSADVLQSWRGMWNLENWAGVFSGCESHEIESRLLMFQNLVTSQILQQGEARVRETVLEIQRLRTLS